MESREFFYSAEPIEIRVSAEEFKKFISGYPRKLERDVCGISEPPAISYNDFELANRWPYSVVARTYMYSDKPGDYYYAPEKDRPYMIMENYEEVFRSRTGNKAIG